jgi:hypothetical protein
MTLAHHKLLHPLPRIQEATIDLRSRPQPSEMSDTELLRFGTVAKYMCSGKLGLDTARRQTFASQLAEVRKEWNRRFPSLPLATTFSLDEP